MVRSSKMRRPSITCDSPRRTSACGGDAGGVLAVEADAAPGQGTIFQRQQVGDGLERGAFARPVAAQQGHDVPARHGQRQAAQGLHDFVVGDLDVVHFEDVIGRLGHHGIGG